MDQNKNEGLEPSSSYLDMSDEDIMNMSFPADEAASEPEQSEGEEGQAEDTGTEEEEFEEDTNTEDTNESDTDEDESTNIDEEDSDGTTDEETTDESEEDEDPGTETEDETTDVEDPANIDYKAKYEKLLAPFKANGKTIKVDNEDDLRRLAQMGVGFNAKMAALKPVRKIAKMLENEGLLDESKINFLIDLSKNNPDAINKLVKDSGINPLDINTESTQGYTPQTYTVDDNQLELDEALADIKQSTTYQQTVDVVSTKWDEASQRVLVDNPQMIRDLDTHMQDGTYEKVMSAVDRERMLGKIPSGVSDLEAYNYMGHQLYAAGALTQAQSQEPATNTPPSSDKAKPKDTKRKVRRRAAGTSSSKPATKPVQPSNYLDLSDEEFEKLLPKYM